MNARAIVTSLLFPIAALGCDYIDAASSDRPNGTQRTAMANIVEGIGGFVSVVGDPQNASDDNFADMHRTAPLGKILDPDAPEIAARIGDADQRVSPTDCITTSGSEVSWECDFISPVGMCTATGSGTANANGTYSGSSAQCCPALPRDEAGVLTASCADAGGSEVILTATNLVFDEVGGTGGGSLHVAVQNHVTGGALADLATVTLDGVGFCTDEPTVAPNSGTLTVDGLGVLEGTAFDPLTIKFTDTPECGVALIE